MPVRLDEATLNLIRSSDADHFSRVVAPLLVAFALPTIALIVTTKDLPAGTDDAWRSAVLALFIASTGFLLAGSQLSVGALLKLRWSSATRAVLTYCGLLMLTGALVLLVLSETRRSSGWLAALWGMALTVLVLGVAIPIALRIQCWVARRMGTENPTQSG